MPASHCGLDVSDKTTHLCVVDADEKVSGAGGAYHRSGGDRLQDGGTSRN
jgi:hypothetical protein